MRCSLEVYHNEVRQVSTQLVAAFAAMAIQAHGPFWKYIIVTVTFTLVNNTRPQSETLHTCVMTGSGDWQGVTWFKGVILGDDDVSMVREEALQLTSSEQEAEGGGRRVVVVIVALCLDLMKRKKCAIFSRAVVSSTVIHPPCLSRLRNRPPD